MTNQTEVNGSIPTTNDTDLEDLEQETGLVGLSELDFFGEDAFAEINCEAQSGNDLLDTLDSLIQEGVQAIAAEKAAKQQLLKARKAQRMLDKKTLMGQVIKTPVPVQRVWTLHAVVALFSEQACVCGATHSHFTGLFIKKSSSGLIQYNRIHQSAIAQYQELPRIKETQTTETEFCTECIPAFCTCPSDDNQPELF